MKHKPLQDKDIFEPFRSATQVDSLGDSPLNHALVAVAQEVAELLKQAYPAQADSSNDPATNRSARLSSEQAARQWLEQRFYQHRKL